VLPPAFSANYHYYVGQAEATFGRHVRACKELERAIAMAEQHGLGELVIKAEAALVSMRDGQTSDRRTAAIPVPPEFAHISDALHGACVAAMAEAT
jgi:hypothetical protein